MNQIPEQALPDKPIGQTALIASLLAFFLGLIGWIIGYVITRGQSLYEQKFGSLLARSYLGSMIYSTVLILTLIIIGSYMYSQDRPQFKALMKDCKTVAASTEASNSIVINTGSRTCELTGAGEDKLYSLLASYLLLFIPFIIFSFYFFYVSIRFIVAASNKTLYRPVICLGGKSLMT